MFTFCTDTLRYSFDEKGMVREFTDIASGKDHAVPGCSAFYLLEGMKTGRRGVPEGRAVLPEAVEADGGLIRVRFAQPAVTFTLAVTEKPLHLRFSIVDQTPRDAHFGRFVFAAAVTDDTDGRSAFSGSARSLCLKCNMLELPGRSERIGSVAYEPLGTVGVSSALIGVPRDRLAEALDEATAHLTIDDIPMSPYGGQHGAEAPGSHDDYVIADRPEIDPDGAWLDPLKRINVRLVDFHQGGMYRQGDYVFLPELFPDGARDFRRKVTDVLHANGMRAGLHTYSGMLDVHCSYVTPEPSEDLASIAVYTLARDLSEDADTLYIEGSADGVAVTQTPHARENVTCLLIDREIVRFSEKGPDGALGKLDRGWLGTRKAAHAAGAKVRHLRCMYGYFQSVPGSALYRQLAANQAAAFNAGGFDSMYFDGLECIGICCDETAEGRERGLNGLGWYYEAMYVQEVLRACKRTPLVEYSTLHPQIWASRSRAGAFDLPYSGYKQFWDIHCRTNELESHRRLLPSQLGWLAVWPPLVAAPQVHDNWNAKIEFDDDADYLGAKAVGYESGLSYLMPEAGQYDECPAMGRMADRLAQYSRLREAGYFGKTVKERLKAYNTGFRLIRDGDGWAFERAERLSARPYSFREGENACTVTNPFGQQRPLVRLIGECTEGAGERMTVLHFDRERPAAEQQLLYEYPKGCPLDLGGREALGIWVMGSGSGECMNIRLEGMHPWGIGYGDHVIPLDFTGWRYFTLCESDNGTWSYMRFTDDIFDPDSIDRHYSRYRDPLRYDGIGRIRILFTGRGEGVRLGDLTAGPFAAPDILDPAVRIGDTALTFRCALRPGGYVEYDPDTGEAYRYDWMGHAEKVETEGSLTLEAGENTAVFTGAADGVRRVKCHLLVRGEMLRNE